MVQPAFQSLEISRPRRKANRVSTAQRIEFVRELEEQFLDTQELQDFVRSVDKLMEAAGR